MSTLWTSRLARKKKPEAESYPKKSIYPYPLTPLPKSVAQAQCRCRCAAPDPVYNAVQKKRPSQEEVKESEWRVLKMTSRIVERSWHLRSRIMGNVQAPQCIVREDPFRSSCLSSRPQMCRRSELPGPHRKYRCSSFWCIRTSCLRRWGWLVCKWYVSVRDIEKDQGPPTKM